jgi:hypothetical protein
MKIAAIRSAAVKTAFALFLAFALSLGLFIFSGEKKTHRAFFFPDIRTRKRPTAMKVSGERRILPLRASRVENIRLVIEDMLLGPTDHRHAQLVSPNVRLLALVYSHGILYIDLSGSILEEDPSVELPLALQIQALGNTILYNFPFVARVFVFIEGQIPVFPSQGDTNFENGVVFSKKILK